MLTEKLLELIQPNEMLLKYLIYLIPQKNLELNELIKEVSIIWRSMVIREHTDLLNIIYQQLQDVDTAYKYIKESDIDKIKQNSQLLSMPVADLLNNYIRIYKIYKILDKFNEKKLSLSDLHNTLSTMILEVQEELEKFTVKEDSMINFINMDKLKNLDNMNILKYACFIPEIDLILNGFSEGLYLFAGTLGSGKSSLLLNLSLGFNIFVNLFEDELKAKVTNNLIPSVLYITVENTFEQTLLRIKAILNDSSPISIIERDTPLKALTELIGLDKLIIINLLYEHASMTNIEKLIKQVINNGYHPTIIIVDYMDEIFITDNMEYRHKFGLISRFLRNLALKYKSVVITATQLNRKAFDGKISIATLSESIEHAKKADAIVMLVTGKTTLNNIKLANYRDLFTDNRSSDHNSPFSSRLTSSNTELPAMFLSVQKNRYNLILSDMGILTSPNCKIGFTSLIEGLDFDISINITNLNTKYIDKKPLNGIINEQNLFIRHVDSCYGRTPNGYHDLTLTTDARSHNTIIKARVTYNEIIKKLREYKEQISDDKIAEQPNTDNKEFNVNSLVNKIDEVDETNAEDLVI